ncbi:hypothetical protein [Runella sp.]|jgi:hypothetical protein|uniref:hypothetical protein n=1 Tax=Runella sp. TaxID=1960881 RepID=UPI0026284E1D|nr:hypothetical protein [Runella sp.]
MTYSTNLHFPFDDETTIDVLFEDDTATLIRKKSWTAAEIEEQVKHFCYTGENLSKDPTVEKAKLPPFALGFYKFIFFKNRLPNEVEFWNYYLGQHFKVVDEQYVQFLRKRLPRKYLAESVKARMLRSYPSLIRDFHFFILCQESKLFERVRYSLREDYFEGIDLNIQFAGVVYQVAVMLNSERARAFKIKKYTRRSENSKNEVIMLFDLYKEAGNHNSKGRIKLFSVKHVNELLIEIQKQTE